MANPTWPGGLPTPHVDGAQFKPWDNAVRTQMDAGAAKVRRRFTAVGEDVTLVIWLEDDEQAELLRAFARDTLKDVLAFDWVDFRNPPQTATYRFKRRPAPEPIGNGQWQATLELELLP